MRAACEQRALKVTPELGDEGYMLDVNPDGVVAAANAAPGKYLSSDGATGNVPKPGELSEARGGTSWGAKFRPDGLTLANITPDDRVLHRVGPGGGMGGVGSEGRNPAARLVTFGDEIAGTPDNIPVAVKRLMDALQRTLGIVNPPVISISAPERLPNPSQAVGHRAQCVRFNK